MLRIPFQRLWPGFPRRTTIRAIHLQCAQLELPFLSSWRLQHSSLGIQPQKQLHMPAALTREVVSTLGASSQADSDPRLGSSLLRIASFLGWNYFFLITNLGHASFLQSSRFSYQ